MRYRYALSSFMIHNGFENQPEQCILSQASKYHYRVWIFRKLRWFPKHAQDYPKIKYPGGCQQFENVNTSVYQSSNGFVFSHEGSTKADYLWLFV